MGSMQKPGFLTNASLMRVDFPTLPPGTSLREALYAMTQARARYALVVDDGELLGLVSDRDLRLAMPSRLQGSSDDPMMDIHTVETICIRRPFIAHPSGNAIVSARLMLERNIGCLPVVDEYGSIHGILTRGDFTRVVAGLYSEEAETEPLAVGSTGGVYLAHVNHGRSDLPPSVRPVRGDLRPVE